MRSSVIVAMVITCTVSCSHPARRSGEDLRATAEQYFSAVYGCRSELLDSLVSDTIVVSYPVFQTILGASAIRGRNAVRQFAERFCRQWADPETTIHEAVQDDRRIVLVWAFRAAPVSVDSLGASHTAAPQNWGGITLLRFDAEGKVAIEVGEESTPGPMARISR